jgi:hypothetical protein
MDSEDIAKSFVISLAALMVVVLGAGLILVIRDSVRREGNFVIPLGQCSCPECGKDTPTVRVPTSGRQAMWGGWTCDHCQCEMDKWGKRMNCVNCSAAVPRMPRPSDFASVGRVDWTCPDCGRQMAVFLARGASLRRQRNDY